MGFHEVQFPVAISYGSRGGPGYSTSVIRTTGGTEERVSRWNEPLRQYNARLGIRSLEDIAAVLEFYIARMGATYGFRWKDWSDFTTAADHRSAPAADDVQIGTGDDSETQFQLVKTYSSGGVTRTRNLEKPVAGTVLVAIDGTPTTSGWTVNTTTGIVTFSVKPATDEVITAGCEFDVPARFGAELDEGALQIQQDFFEAETLPDVPVMEIRSGEPTQDEFFFGGALVAAVTDAQDLSLLTARVYVLTPDESGHAAWCPDPTGIPDGFPHFIVSNASDTYYLYVRDYGGDALVNLAPGETAMVFLAGGEWMVLT